MSKSEGINKKIIIVIFIMVLLLGTIMMINLLSRNKKNINVFNENANNVSDDVNIISENENIILENNSNISEDELIVVTNQFTSSEEKNHGIIKVTTNGPINDKYEPVKDNTNNKEPVIIEGEDTDKTAPNVTVIYSKQNITNDNVVVTLKFNEPIERISNDYTLLNGAISATKEYTNNATEEVKVCDLAGNETIVKIEINNIDKTMPQLAKVSDTIFATNKIQTKLTIADNESGLNFNGCKYKIDNIEEIQDENGYTKIEDTTTLVEKTVNSDGDYFLHVISMDNAGNIRKDTIKLTVDSVMPILNIKYSNTAITNKDVVVTITSNKPMQEVPGWKANQDKTIFIKTYTENVDEEVEFTDLVGRKIKAQIKINNIDKADPKEPKLSNNIFNTKPVDNSKNIDITLTTNIKDNENGSGLNLSKCKYILNESSNAPTDFNSASTFTKENQTMYFTIKENSTYYLHIKLVDLAGNEKITTQTIISDTLNPVVTREYDIKDHTNKNVVVTIKSNETLQGTEGWEVFDNGKTLRKEFNKNINKTIFTFSDLAGNKVSVDVTISNIDQDAPNDSKINKNLFNTKEFSVVTNISDVGFGLNLAECKYILSSEETSNFDEAATFIDTDETLKLKVNEDGIYYLHTLLKDEVGNEKITTHKITVDSTKANIDVSYSNTQITNENVIVTLKSDEELQQLSGWNLSSDKKKLTKTFSANTDMTIDVKDIAGNITNVKVSIKNIDKTKPIVEIKYSTSSQTIESVTVTIKANEKIQSIKGWTLSSDQTTLTKVFTENDAQTITIRDIAGNTISESIVVSNII